MERLTKSLVKSILAGFVIGIGGIIYLSCDSKFIGAFLFSFGLMMIVIHNLSLYTGMIGYVNSTKNLTNIFIIIFGNFIGVYIVSLMCRMANLNIFDKAFGICNLKFLTSPFQFFIRSILCGVMMFLAVESYKKTNNLLPLCMPIIVFILSGFEHSIANMFYFSLVRVLDSRFILYTLLALVGNGIGAKMFYILLKWGGIWKA